MTAQASDLGPLWQALANSLDADLPLLEGAFLIARDEYPSLPVPEYLAVLDRIAAAASERLTGISDGSRQRLGLNEVLFDEWGFEGDTESYYDPRNSYLNEVLDRRRGIPITLSVIYLEMARRSGIQADGLGFPGHFLVRLGGRDGLVVDPFNAGSRIDPNALGTRLEARHSGAEVDAATLRRWLKPVSSRAILVRMLRNLKAIYLAREDAQRALRTSDRIVTLLPRYAPEYRDRGLIYQALEVPHAALADFRRYLELLPQAEDADAIRDRIDGLGSGEQRLH